MAGSEEWRDVARFLASGAFDRRRLSRRDLRDSVVMSLRDLDDPLISGPYALELRGASLWQSMYWLIVRCQRMTTILGNFGQPWAPLNTSQLNSSKSSELYHIKSLLTGLRDL